jgi:putative oxidoreductase
MLKQLQNDAVGKLVVRLTVGILMLFHGIAKVLHPGTLDFIGGALTGAGLPGVLAYCVYLG